MAYPDEQRLTHTAFFLQQLETLNAAQQTAVQHIDGPMLVVAGTGPGKSQVLAARIVQILLETDGKIIHNVIRGKTSYILHHKLYFPKISDKLTIYNLSPFLQTILSYNANI
jgi:hypothetical protein